MFVTGLSNGCAENSFDEYRKCLIPAGGALFHYARVITANYQRHMQFCVRAEIIGRAERISAVCSGSFMTSSAVAMSSLSLAGLRLLCTIGSCAGFAAVMFGLCRDRKEQMKPLESGTQSVQAGSLGEESRAESSGPSQIVRLTTDPAPSRSSDMSQQEKIAAALSRAGIAKAAWSSPIASGTATAPTTAPAQSPTTPHDISTHVRTHSPSRTTRKLLLLGGGLLVLLSLSVLLSLR